MKLNIPKREEATALRNSKVHRLAMNIDDAFVVAGLFWSTPTHTCSAAAAASSSASGGLDRDTVWCGTNHRSATSTAALSKPCIRPQQCFAAE
jgi:hypothetical protein